MGDAKQPPLKVGNRSRLGERLDRLHERFLDHVLAIDDRTRHARAVAMQLRSQLAEQPIEGRAVFIAVKSQLIHFNKIKHCRRVATRYESSRPTTSHLSSLRQYGFGCALMSPQPTS